MRQEFYMTPEQAMLYAREDIADLRIALTQSSCDWLHTSISSYCRALLDCGLISAGQFDVLMAEADAGQTGWRSRTDSDAVWPDSDVSGMSDVGPVAI
jgi:hypothetical protein